jgi:cytoplasmic iron level regulating protein YaaA (DUF328/UPF0246 family)
MLILLSPAKTLDLASAFEEQPSTPRFANEAARLARAAARLGAGKLSEIMHISQQLAQTNHQRFKQFAGAPERPAIRTFAGDVYRGFDVASTSSEILDYAQRHLRILSGLYGLVRPLDAVRPYRLEMGTRWSPRGERLLDFWGDKVGKAVRDELRAEGSGILLNLASNEYFAAVGKPPRGGRVISPDFRVRSARGLQFQSFPAKVARGALARFVCEERIEDPEALASFDSDGWRFEENGSEPDRPLFVRNAVDTEPQPLLGG